MAVPASLPLLVWTRTASHPVYGQLTSRPGPVFTADDLDKTRWLLSSRDFRLVVMLTNDADRDLPKLRSVREAAGLVPVLAVADDADTHHVRLLRAGADMVLDSASAAELLSAAIEALTRRPHEQLMRLRYLDSPGIRIDTWTRTAVLEQDEIRLTLTEFDFLHLLMSRPRITVERHEIMRLVWGWKYSEDPNPLRLLVRRLRAKLGPVGKLIGSVYRVGYRFDGEVTEFAEKQSLHAGPSGVAALERFTRLQTTALVSAGGSITACQSLLDTSVELNVCDGAAMFVHRPGTRRLELVGQAGMADEWSADVAKGLPVDGDYLAAHTFTSGQVQSVVDVARLRRRFNLTAGLLHEADSPAVLSIPLMDAHGAWGQLGFSRRQGAVFSVPECIALEALGAVLGVVSAENLADRG